MNVSNGRYALTARLLSRTAFSDYVRHRGESYSSLAEKVSLLGVRERPVPVRCSKATIGHLATGEVRGTSPARARLIERALNAPPGSLFLFEVTRVADVAGRRLA